MSIREFTEAARRNFEVHSAHDCYTVGIKAIDRAYEAAIASLPPQGYPNIYGKWLLVCHKHMVSAANLIATGLPEDSAGVTRRAAEAAKVATAISLNDANLQAWLSYAERHERWMKRQSAEKPKSFHVRYEDLQGNEFSKALDKYIGVLSDAYVHFTPEFHGRLSWRVTNRNDQNDGEIGLDYFQSSTREIERHFLLLIAVHGKILQAFDRCVGGYLYEQPACRSAVDHLWRTAKLLNDRYSGQQDIGNSDIAERL